MERTERLKLPIFDSNDFIKREDFNAASRSLENNLLKDTTAALYGLGAEAVPDDIFAAIPGTIDPIGTVKVTARKDLGENWALCNGDQYFPADVSQEFWEAASDPDVLYNGTLGTKILPVELDSNYTWATTSVHGEIKKIISADDTGWYWFFNNAAKHFELYFSNDFFQTFKKISIDADTANSPIVIYFKGSYYVWFEANRYIWKLAGLDEPDAALSITKITGPSILVHDFLAISEAAIYVQRYVSGDSLSYIYKISDIENETAYTASDSLGNYHFYGIYFDKTSNVAIIYGVYIASKNRMIAAILNESKLTISNKIEAADSSRGIVGRSITKLIDGSFLLRDDTVGKRFTLTGSTLEYISGNSSYEFDIRKQASASIYHELPEESPDNEYILVDKSNGLIFVKYDQASGTFVVSNTNSNAVVLNGSTDFYILWNADRTEFVISRVYNVTTKPSIATQPTNKLPAIDLDKVYAYIRIR